MKHVFLILIALILLSKTSFSQDTVMLVNGNAYSCKIKEINKTECLIFGERQKKNKTKKVEFDLTEVFSITYSDGRKEIIYKQDTTKGLNLTVEEATNFVAGEVFAKTYYKPKWVTISSGVIGAGSALIVGPFLGLIAPTAYVGVLGAIPANTKKLELEHPAKSNNPNFKQGYITEARRKRIMNSIWGGLIGVGTAVLISTTVYLAKGDFLKW